MTVRRPNPRIAAVEIAFVALSGIAGFMSEPWWWAGLFALGNAAHWAWSRRSALARIAPPRLPGQVGVSLAVIALVHAGLYGLGRLFAAAG